MAASSVPLLLLMLLYPLLPESPYWLLATGRTREVRMLLQRIARMNGRDLPPGRLQPSAQARAKVSLSTHLSFAMQVCTAVAPRAREWMGGPSSKRAAELGRPRARQRLRSRLDCAPWSGPPAQSGLCLPIQIIQCLADVSRRASCQSLCALVLKERYLR